MDMEIANISLLVLISFSCNFSISQKWQKLYAICIEKHAFISKYISPKKSQKNENFLPKKSLVGISVSLFGNFASWWLKKNKKQKKPMW